LSLQTHEYVHNPVKFERTARAHTERHATAGIGLAHVEAESAPPFDVKARAVGNEAGGDVAIGGETSRSKPTDGEAAGGGSVSAAVGGMAGRDFGSSEAVLDATGVEIDSAEDAKRRRFV